MTHELLSTARLAVTCALLFATPAHAQRAEATSAETPAEAAPAQSTSPELPAEPTVTAPTDAAPAGNGRAREARNSIFFEAIGAGIYPSLNYERMLTDELGLRVGLSVASFAFR